MDEKPVELQDILHSVVKGENVRWDGAFCYYKGVEIITVFGENHITLVWVRQSIPDTRETMLRPEDPQFFQILKTAVRLAKKVVDEVEETKRVFDVLRNHMLGKPDAGSVA